MTAAPSIGWADKQPLTESRTWGHGPARRTTFCPSDAVSAAKKFVALQSFNANGPTLFRDLKSAESQPHHVCRVLGLDCLPATGRSPGTAWTVTRDTRLLSGHQIWGLAPEFAATFWTGFSLQKIFLERLFSGTADYRLDAYQPVPKTIRRRSRHLPFQLEEMSAHHCRSQLFLFYFRPQKPFSLG